MPRSAGPEQGPGTGGRGEAGSAESMVECTEGQDCGSGGRLLHLRPPRECPV